MAALKSNKLIAIGAVIVVVIVAGIMFRGNKSTPKNVPLASVPEPTIQATKAPDADSPADTLRTLTAEVKSMKDREKKLVDDNKDLKQQNEDLIRNRKDIEESVTNRLAQQFSRPEAAGSPVFAGMNSRLDGLESKLNRLLGGDAQVGPPGAAIPAAGGDIPTGLGFDGRGTAMPSNSMPVAGTAGAAAAASPVRGNTYVYVEPLGEKTVLDPNGQPKVVKVAYAAGGPQKSAPGALPSDQGTSDTGAPGVMPGAADATQKQPVPYFTVPENAVLMNSTAMTALIGRIPVNNNVRDPMEFKVLVGRPNLAANGLQVPDDVVGMVVAGQAIGDWNLQCVEGHIYSITFLFQDGTIKTVSKRQSSGGAGGGLGGPGGGVNNASRMGFITDEHGAPCINGKLITNAPAYLTQVVGIKALEAAARAAAAAQTTTSVNPLGGSSSVVTGDQSKYIMGQAASAGVDEVSNWVMKRLNDSFDAIYVPPGIKVAVHLNQEIDLDKDPNARNLDYGRPNTTSSRRARRAALD